MREEKVVEKEEEEVQIELEKSPAGPVCLDSERGSSHRSEDLNTTSKGTSEEKIVCSGMKLSKKGNKNIDNLVKSQKQVISRKCHTNVLFKPEEDRILLEAIRSGEQLDFTKLAKKMNRNSGSVINRVNKLKFTGVSTKAFSSYTLLEDLTIIDSAVKNLQQSSKLDDVFLKDAEDLADRFRRKAESVRGRWTYTLIVWLKSYYKKTLNLDIRIMLANYVADNFDSIDSIDWNKVLAFEEFSAYSIHSIRYKFHSVIVRSAQKYSQRDSTCLTLREIAQHASVVYSKENVKKIRATVLARQTEVINHFEKKVKDLGIKNFL